LVLALAVIVEAVVEYGKSVGKMFTDGGWKTGLTQLAAAAVSMALCFAAGADLFAVLGLDFGQGWIGTALTGLFASRGANFLSDLVERLRGMGQGE